MGRYRAARDYRASSSGVSHGYTQGAECEVDDATAEWVNRDSPGTLVPLDAAPEPEPEPDAEAEEPKPKRTRRSAS